MNNSNKMEETPFSTDEFAQKLIKLNIFKLLMTVLPEYCNDYDSKINFIINSGNESNGVAIDLSIESKLKEEESYNILFKRLQKTNRLLELEFLIPELKKAGVNNEYINELVQEGEMLAQSLYKDI